MSVSYLVTHSGGFHADELLSSVILTRLYPDAEILRSRDPQVITPAADRLIYDVGRDYDAAKGIFDHHQKEAPLREDGQPFSSFGLIWRHFGEAYLEAMSVPPEDRAAIHASFDRSFVLPVDMMDNGVIAASQAGSPLADLTLPVLLESLKPVFDDETPGAENLAFHTALGIARVFVEAAIGRRAAQARANSVVRAAIAAAGDSAVLELPRGMPFRSAVVKAGADHLLFVVHPRDRDWTLTGIRKRDEGFENRADLPQSWAGLTDHELEAASGVPGAKFCHNGRFIAVASSREAILAMAAIAVREAKATAAAAEAGAAVAV